LYGYVLQDPINFIDPNGLWVALPRLGLEIVRGAFGVRNFELACGKAGGGELNSGEDEALVQETSRAKAEEYFKDKGYNSIPQAPAHPGGIQINPNPYQGPQYQQRN